MFVCYQRSSSLSEMQTSPVRIFRAPFKTEPTHVKPIELTFRLDLSANRLWKWVEPTWTQRKQEISIAFDVKQQTIEMGK